MQTGFQFLEGILDRRASPQRRVSLIRGFAEELRWSPSYEYTDIMGDGPAHDHLLVEYGLDTATVISFVQSPHEAGELTESQLRQISSLSYNNLLDWHIFVSRNEAMYVNNRTKPLFSFSEPIGRNNITPLSSDRFRELTNRKVPTRWATCENALITVISRWKKLLKGELDRRLTNQHISAFFNTIMFFRSFEDHQIIEKSKSMDRLYDLSLQESSDKVSPLEFFTQAAKKHGLKTSLKNVIDIPNLEKIPSMDRVFFHNLIRDFYHPQSAPQEFNFAFMSKHALSRIYERYVSILRFDEGTAEGPRQQSFLPPLPVEIETPKTGAIYTPQFVASFFTKFVCQNVAPKRQRNMRVLDPAAGSGIFLRTFLEAQSNPFASEVTPQSIAKSFSAVTGIDSDANACEATRLSLSLLHFVSTESFPKKLDIRNVDAIREFSAGRINSALYDLVMANPPYIPAGRLAARELNKFKQFLGSSVRGRIDTYLAFVKLCLSVVKEDGFVCLVLPQAFFYAANANPLRDQINKEFSVRSIVDLSNVPVFGSVGTYTILLILQRCERDFYDERPTLVVQVRALVGQALQACLDGRLVSNKFYSVFEVDKNEFKRSEWYFLPPKASNIRRQIESFPRINEFLDVKQGIVTGSDSVFIRKSSAVGKTERSIYLRLLRDRAIGLYDVPRSVPEVVFYPYLKKLELDEQILRSNYPETWDYLSAHRKELEKRYAVQRRNLPWWRPETPRAPENLLRPKIVCPHLMLTPRFAVDVRGNIAISRAPFFIAKDRAQELSLLYYFCGVLNSSPAFWYISTYSFKYGGGYNRLEVGTLRKIPVPDPARIPATSLEHFISLVEDAHLDKERQDIENEIDELACEYYGFHPEIFSVEDL